MEALREHPRRHSLYLPATKPDLSSFRGALWYGCTQCRRSTIAINGLNMGLAHLACVCPTCATSLPLSQSSSNALSFVLIERVAVGLDRPRGPLHEDKRRLVMSLWQMNNKLRRQLTWKWSSNAQPAMTSQRRLPGSRRLRCGSSACA